MLFWTVEDACPYKERLNFLMRTSLYSPFFCCLGIGKNVWNVQTDPEANLHILGNIRVSEYWGHLQLTSNMLLRYEMPRTARGEV